MTNKIEANRSSRHSFFLPSEGDTCFKSLDGSDVVKWLCEQGYDVAKHYDTGRNGLAVTKCGVRVSTNGHVSYAR